MKLQTQIWFLTPLITLCMLAACGEKQEQASAEAPRETTPQAALDSLTRLIELYPENADLKYERSLLYYQHFNEREKAMADIEAAIRADSMQGRFFYQRGFYKHVAEQDSPAFRDFIAAHDKGFPAPENAHMIAKTFILWGEPEKAIVWLKRAVEQDPDDPFYHFALARAYREAGRTDDAIKQAGLALNRDSTHVKTLNMLVDLYLNERPDEDLALHFNKKILDADSLNPVGRFNMGYYFWRAAETARKAGARQEQRQFLQNSIAQYTKAVQGDPQYSMAYYQRGMSYLDVNDYQQAINDFEKAAELNPKNHRAHFMLGSMQEHFKNYAEARKHYQAALDAKPDFADARTAVAELRGK